MVAELVGWIYFLSWSLSSWPQAILNYKRKSVQGVSLDYNLLNLIGYICYCVYTITFYYNDSIRKQYSKIHNGEYPLISLSDVGYSIHSLILTFIKIYQLYIYTRDPDQQISKICIWFTEFILFCSFISFISGLMYSNLIPFLFLCSYIKVLITIIKYAPQVYMNYKSKSTKGWSIGQIILDVIGSLFSTIELFMNGNSYFDSIKRNPAKFSLSMVSNFYDFVFIIQHYVLYKNDYSNLENLEDVSIPLT